MYGEVKISDLLLYLLPVLLLLLLVDGLDTFLVMIFNEILSFYSFAKIMSKHHRKWENIRGQVKYHMVYKDY